MKIALVDTIIVKNDAVSNVARDRYFAIKEYFKNQPVEIKAYSLKNDYSWQETVIIRHPFEVVYKDFFSHDIYIFSWAIFSPFFPFIRIIKEMNPRAKVIIRFHNVTPIELVAANTKNLILESYKQFVLFDLADKIWADSEFNKQDLLNYGIKAEKIEVLPPAIQFKSSKPLLLNELLAHKKTSKINLLFVGRFYPSKGVHDLIEACRYILKQGVDNFKLTLVSSLRFSDPLYLKKGLDLIKVYRLDSHIEFVEDVTEHELEEIFKRTHIFVTASLHEGFCVPIVEALYYGCYPIAYHNSNLPYIINQLGQTVDNKNVEDLAECLFKITSAFSNAHELEQLKVEVKGVMTPYSDFLELAIQYARSFEQESINEKFFRLFDKIALC